MATSNQLIEPEHVPHSSGVPLDPFAGDFFGGKNPLADENEAFSEIEIKSRRAIKPRKKSDWYKILPRVTNEEAEFSNRLQNLPANLTQNAARIVAETLARYTFRPAESAECALISAAEINLSEAADRLAETSQIFLTVTNQSKDATALIVLNKQFAKALIDSILGESGAESGDLRKISPIETTILEFLAANILGEVNKLLGEPLLYLQSVKTESNGFFETSERGAEIVLSLEVDEFKGIISLIAPPKFLNGLDRAQNPLLAKKSDEKGLANFEKIARAFDLRVQVGTTFLDADSLLFLEPDDIVLIEQPQIGLGREKFGGNLQVFVGSGKNFRFRGDAENSEFSGDLYFKIEEILSEETRRKFTPAKFKMDEKENELAEEASLENNQPGAEESEEELFDEQLSPALENIQVALRIEIAGNKISLRELQNLRAGQIIGLGCSPTDPVRLVTDNNEEPVAAGELIEIEGQLGVRLTKVFI